MTSEFRIDLTERVALVTGASRGIGRECARFLAQAGASVAINYMASQEAAELLAAEIGFERAIPVRADMGDPQAVHSMIATVIDRFGRLDILVNNAALFAENRFDGHDYARWQHLWQRTLDVNLLGPANAFYLAYPHMKRQGGGKVVNIASRAAFRGETEFADYGASKAGLVNLTRSIARACAKDNIIATCVAPGWVETDMATEAMATNGAAILAEIPMGKLATPADVANLVVFLASPLSDHLNGATIDINGGSYLR